MTPKAYMDEKDNKIKDYLIMSGDIKVAEWRDRELKVINDRLLPLYLKRVSDADRWLETRAIDSHRANSRLLKKALRLAERDDVSTVIYAHGATITDNYWIKSPEEELSYRDVRFDNSYFARLALTGDYDSFNKAAARCCGKTAGSGNYEDTAGRSRLSADSRYAKPVSADTRYAKSSSRADSESGDNRYIKTPELTNTGSFEKCWKLIGGKWYMYKQAKHDELFSELFAYELGKQLGMNMALYERGNGYIKTLDFTNDASVNFEPAAAFMGDNEDYEDVLKALGSLCPDAIPDYIRMIFLDTLIANPDRHTNNFGLLRDNISGKLIGPAPNFDNNMALIARGYPSMPGRSDVLIRLFREVIEAHPEYCSLIPQVSTEHVSKCIDNVHMRVRKSYITELIMRRYELITQNYQ